MSLLDILEALIWESKTHSAAARREQAQKAQRAHQTAIARDVDTSPRVGTCYLERNAPKESVTYASRHRGADEAQRFSLEAKKELDSIGAPVRG